MWLEVVASGEQALCVACTIFVTRYLHIIFAQISVRISVRACAIGDVNIMAVTECWTIAAVSIYGMFCVFYVKHKGFQTISVFKRK